MKLCRFPLLLSLLLCLAIALTRAQAQTGGANQDAHRKQIIQTAFRRNWDAYAKYGYPADMLNPVDQNGMLDPATAGWSGTLIDSLGTFIVMGLGNTPEYKQLLEDVKKMDFTKPTKVYDNEGEVSLFELTIKIMGGLLSAFQTNGEKSEEKFLVDQAKVLADGLIVAWEGQNKIPFNRVNLLTKKPQDNTKDVNLAEAGTLTLEWGMLSKFTGDPKYARLTQGSVDTIINSKSYFPSLWANRIWPKTGVASSTYISTGGGCDSFIEYLIKFAVLEGNRNHRYAQTYGKMIDTIQDKLVSKTGVNNLTFIADYDIQTNKINYVGSHLACFAGGNIAYAGRLFNRDDWTQLGLEITESCYQTYKATAMGIGPYAFGWYDKNREAAGYKGIPNGRKEFYNQHGIFITVGDWVQHPEVIESLFYAWRITGDEMWKEMAWEAWQQIQHFANTDIALAGIKNTNDESSDLWNQTEEYLYSQILKYLYLMFSDVKEYSLDEYLFTTEGHIFKRGSGPVATTTTTSHGSKRSLVTERVEKRSGTWGKVQGSFSKYIPLIPRVSLNANMGDLKMVKSVSESDSKFGSMKLQVDPSEKLPDGVHFAEPGAGRKAYAQSLVSLLGINVDVAVSLVSRLPVNGQSSPVKPANQEETLNPQQ